MANLISISASVFQLADIGRMMMIYIFLVSCNGGSTKKDSDAARQNLPRADTSETVKREIRVGGKTFVITEIPVSRYLYMGKDTAEYFFSINGDSLCISCVYTLPGGVIDVYESVFLQKNDIDTASSELNGITLNEGNANEFSIRAKAGSSFRFVSYQKDSAIVQSAATEARLVVKSDSTADYIGRLMGVYR